VTIIELWIGIGIKCYYDFNTNFGQGLTVVCNISKPIGTTIDLKYMFRELYFL